MLASVRLCHWASTGAAFDGSPRSATATAKVAPPASQPSMDSVLDWPPSGTIFCALSGLQGNRRLSRVFSGRTSRQLKAGLQAAKASSPAAAESVQVRRGIKRFISCLLYTSDAAD